MSRMAVGIALAVLLAVPAAAQQEHHGEHHGTHSEKHDVGKGHGHHAHRFKDPEKWAKRFDNPERDAWQMPNKVVAALSLKPDDRVADIGAGTGYFTVRLAKAVPKGAVYAVDVEKSMVDYLAKRADTEQLANVRAVQGGETSANLPEPVDVVLLVNSFHHIEARVQYIRALATSLRQNGRIALIEYRPDATRGAPKHFRLSVAQIDKDMADAGFRRTEAHDFLPHQNFLVYQIARQAN